MNASAIPARDNSKASTMAQQIRQHFQIQPLSDPRWDSFLQKHPRASVFHSTPWLHALSKTYGYEPIALTNSPADAELRNALVACRVESWFTGRRLVSLPFSDHAESLVDDPDDLQDLFSGMEATLRQEKLRYIELRPLANADFATSLFQSAQSYCFQRIDLTPDLDSIFKKFHKDSIQRKIRRAEKEKLIYKDGLSNSLLSDFYGLFVMTRKRHGLPPQPRKWFGNLVEAFGDALKIRVAFHGNQPVASILTIKFKDTLVYKYGCSDAKRNNLGGMPLLFWRSIQEAHEQGLRTFDLGRSEFENAGLITFKERWGATRSTLTYTRYHSTGKAGVEFTPSSPGWKFMTKQVFSNTPSAVLTTAGRVLYRHIG